MMTQKVLRLISTVVHTGTVTRWWCEDSIGLKAQYTNQAFCLLNGAAAGVICVSLCNIMKHHFNLANQLPAVTMDSKSNHSFDFFTWIFMKVLLLGLKNSRKILCTQYLFWLLKMHMLGMHVIVVAYQNNGQHLISAFNTPVTRACVVLYHLSPCSSSLNVLRCAERRRFHLSPQQRTLPHARRLSLASETWQRDWWRVYCVCSDVSLFCVAPLLHMICYFPFDCLKLPTW